MAYIALARKWRPKTFSQLLGQDTTTQALINSLQQQRLHHAYLFTGTRGVGKTSIARLLAKAMNCETGITAEPCLTCPTCLSIERGEFIDLIEIDAASRTKVEDTREILDNVQYLPTSGRFKIYLIDEVHMLSNHSFNALLKTLEEPPAHVKFLLATTDSQKLPITILSRCLQFHLKHLTPEVITQQLQTILQAEGQAYELPALLCLAKAGKGSMRDALSLLDQALVSANTTLQLTTVKSMLGYTQQDIALQLLQALAQKQGDAIIQLCRQIGQEGGGFQYVLDSLLDSLHQIALGQILGANNPVLALDADLQTLSQQLNPEDVQLFYQIALKGNEDMLLAPTLSIGFEMILLRMLAFMPVSRPALTHSPMLTPITAAAPTATAEKPIPKPIPASTPTPVATETSWHDILPKLNLTGLTKNAAEQAEWLGKDEHSVTLGVDKKQLSIFTPSIVSRIEQAFTYYYQHPIKLKLKSQTNPAHTPAQEKIKTREENQATAKLSMAEDPMFQELKETVDGEWVFESLK